MVKDGLNMALLIISFDLIKQWAGFVVGLTGQYFNLANYHLIHFGLNGIRAWVKSLRRIIKS